MEATGVDRTLALPPTLSPRHAHSLMPRTSERAARLRAKLAEIEQMIRSSHWVISAELAELANEIKRVLGETISRSGNTPHCTWNGESVTESRTAIGARR